MQCMAHACWRVVVCVPSVTCYATPLAVQDHFGTAELAAATRAFLQRLQARHHYGGDPGAGP